MHKFRGQRLTHAPRGPHHAGDGRGNGGGDRESGGQLRGAPEKMRPSRRPQAGGGTNAPAGPEYGAALLPAHGSGETVRGPCIGPRNLSRSEPSKSETIVSRLRLPPRTLL